MSQLKKTKMGYGAWILMATLFWSLFPEQAFADTSFFSPVPGDKSVEMLLKPIFGPLFDGAGAAGFVAAIKLFNAAALSIGGMLAAYTLVAGTMQTAHDGEMLGKRWSSMWLPIRTVLGVGLVVPTSSGFCVAQMLVAWLALQGVGLADNLWSAYVNAYASSSNMAPKIAMPTTREFAKGVLESMVCVEAGNRIRQSATAILTTPFVAMDQPGGKGRQYGSGDYPTICGGVNFATIKPPTISGDQASIMNLASTPAERTAAADAIRLAHIAATAKLETSLLPLAKAVADSVGGAGGGAAAAIDASILDKSADQYQIDVATAAAGVFGGNGALDAVKTSATSDGWILAGAWFMRAAQLQDLVNKAASSTPSAIPPLNISAGEAGAAGYDKDFAKYYAKLEGVLGNSVGQFGIEQRGSAGQSSNDMDKWGKEVFHHFAEPFTKSFTLDPNRHPLMALKDFGDYTMVASEAGLLAGGAVMAAAGVSSLGFLNGALMYFGILILTLLGTIMAFATMASVYFPVLPFIIFFGTALGWLILVAEAVIAVPMAAIMKLSPGGDDIMGGAKPAYMLLLGLTLRPALTILGFILSLTSVEFFLRLFNQAFFPVFFSSMGESVVGIVTFAVGIGIYFGTLTYLLHKAFGLCHVVPDQILRWIGSGGGEAMGQWGGGTGESAKGNVGAVIGNISNRTSSASDSMGRNMTAGKANEISEKKAMLQAKQGASAQDSKTPEMQAKASQSAAAANAPDASTSDMVQAVSDRSALANHHSATSGAFSSAELPERATKHAELAERESGAAQNMVGKIESRAESGEKTAQSAAPNSVAQASAYRQAETDFKAARDANNIMGNSSRAADFNKKADTAGTEAARIEASLATAPAPSPAAGPTASPPPAATDGGDGSGA